MTTVGLLHPGEMGAVVGGCLVAVGHEVIWDPAGRSRASTGRALAAELTGVRFDVLVARSAVILSICPPHAALDIAHQVASAGFAGIYVDANAISVATAEQVAAIVTAAGATYVDGGIIGPPPQVPGSTRLYLSGPHASEVRPLFSRSSLDARIADGSRYAASAVKMAYSAWTKGSSALLLAARALARASGVEGTLLAEWALSQHGLAAQSERSAGTAVAKGWRWIAEMEEISASMAAAGLPPEFHEAAAEIYDRAARAARAARAGASGARRATGEGRARSGESERSSALDTVMSALT